MVNTVIRLIIFFAAKDGEALYSQQKQDWELTVAQIMNSLLPNINNLRYADDTTLMAESEEELKSLLMRVKEESGKVGLKLSSGHRTGKCQISFQSQRKAMPKNVQTTTQLHSSHMLASNAQNSPSQASTIHEP